MYVFGQARIICLSPHSCTAQSYVGRANTFTQQPYRPLARSPSVKRVRQALLVGLVAWSAARLYYFMFYVIEKYVDPQFKFAGIGAFVLYLIRRRTDRPKKP